MRRALTLLCLLFCFICNSAPQWVWFGGQVFNDELVTTRGNSTINNVTGSFANSISQIEVSATMNATNIYIIVGNQWGDTPGANTTTNGESIYDLTAHNGITNVFTWSGNILTNIQPGSLAFSDRLPISLVAGHLYLIRSLVIPQTGGTYIKGATLAPFLQNRSAEGFIVNSANPTAALTNTAAGSATTTDNGFVAIKGQTTLKSPSVAIFGDSIMAGVIVAGDTLEMNYVTWGIGGPAQNTTAWINNGKSSETALTFSTTYKNRIAGSANAKFALCEYGINDLIAGNSFLQITQSLINCWNVMASNSMVVYQMTMTPRTNLTAAQSAVRTNLNNWILSSPSPLTGHFDVMPWTEYPTTNFSNLWISNQPVAGEFGSADGIHPLTNETAYIGSNMQVNFTNVFK